MREHLTRRRLMLGGAVAVGGYAIMSRPSDQSGPRDDYFLNMQAALTDAGIATPTLVIDRAKLNQNIDTLKADLPEGMAYRIVAKSLPSVALISHVAQRAGTNRLMTFNLPMLRDLSIAMPEADQLLGKPLPAAAVRAYFEQLPEAARPAAANVQWLVDTPQRLQQYADIAEAYSVDMRIALELDVGLHRGGFVPGEAFDGVLGTLRQSNRLSLSALMGYEPHLASIPTALGWQGRAIEGAWNLYKAAQASVAATMGEAALNTIVLNAAGSPTYRLYKDTSLANEVSVGSALVKPTHFDTELLAAHNAASFIATPVIKAMDKTNMPGLEFMDGPKRAMNPNTSKTVFIYGGHWLADPVDPPGLSYNKTFGRSSNQEMLNGGPNLSIAPDEFVFLRPHQSEAVFLQFGDIAVYDNGKIIDTWTVFPASA